MKQRYEVRRLGTEWEVTDPSGDCTLHVSLTMARRFIKEHSGGVLPGLEILNHVGFYDVECES